jgi:hypothetical protein
VPQRPLAIDHRVLMRPEAGQRLGHEALQGASRLGAVGRPAARAVLPPALQTEAVKLSADLAVVLGLPRAIRRRGLRLDQRPLPGRRLAIVRVEVPASAARLLTVHQQIEPPPLAAVEVLHQQRAPAVGPLGELCGVGEEQRALDELNPVEPPERLPPARAVRCEQSHPIRVHVLAVAGESPRERVGVNEVDRRAPRPQIVGEVAHRDEHQVQLLAVKAPGRHRRRALYEQHTVSPVERRILQRELVPEDPCGRARHGTEAARCGRALSRAVRCWCS